MKIDRRSWLMVGVLLALGCTSYPPVSSRDSLRLLSALRTACSSKNVERLAKTENAIRTASLSDTERSAFERIVDHAKAGRWERAEEACIAFQEVQIR